MISSSERISKSWCSLRFGGQITGGLCFGAGNAKNVEIIVARKIVFDIFRAPFDRNRCAGILAE